MKTPRQNLLHAALSTLIFTSTASPLQAANSISLKFTDAAAGDAITTGTPGALPITAANWNNFASVNGSGSGTGLKDNGGAVTPAAVSWAAANTWRSGGTTTGGNGQLTKGYLDDGGGGNLITVSNIPYLSYNAYIVVATDQGGATQGNANYSPINVNGLGYTYNGTGTAAGTANWIGQNWNDGTSLVEGKNFLKIPNQGGLTLTVRGNNIGGFRGSIAGIQIQDTYAGAYSYWDLNGTAAGAGSATPTGTWSSAAANWSAAADGTGTASVWGGAGHTAVFAAGNGATGAYTVTVAGTQNADGIIAQQGTVTLTGGGVNLSSPAVVRALGGASLNVGSPLSGTGGVVLEGSGAITVSGANPISGPAVFSASSLNFASGASLPSLSSVSIANNVALTGSGYTIGTTGNVSAGDGAVLTPGSSTFNVGGDLKLTGAAFNASGTTTLSARNLSLKSATAAAAINLSGSAAISLTSTAPALSNLEFDGGFIDLAGNSSLTTDLFGNRGTGASSLLTIEGNAQFHVTQNLVLGNDQGAPMSVTQTGGTVTNTGTNDAPNTDSASNRWGLWPAADSSYDISGGTLNLTGAPLYLSWDSAGELDISGTATVNLKGVSMGFGSRSQNSTINLTGGQLNIGSAGIVAGGTAGKVVNLGGGTLGATADWTSDAPMEVTGSPVVNTGDFSISLQGDMEGDGSLTKTGNGTLALTGFDTFTGPVNVNAGTFKVGGETDAAINVAAGATIGTGDIGLPGTGSTSALNLASGSASNFRVGPEADSFSVSTAGGLKTTTSHTINISGEVGLTAGVYTLFDYSGSIAGTGYSAFALGSKPHITATLQNNTANSSVVLAVTAVDSLVWTGANGSAWNVNTAQNWGLASNSSAAPYFQTDVVQFKDSATTGNVVLSGSITPAQVNFNNSTLAYTLSGAGIGGATDLNKDGTAKVTLLNVNTYIGLTNANAGTLQVGDGTAGSINPQSPVTIAEGAEFILNPATSGEFANPVSNSGIFHLIGTASTSIDGVWGDPNSGNIVIDSTGMTSFPTSKSSWIGNLTLNAGTLQVTGTNAQSLGSGDNARTLTVNGASTVLSLGGSNIFGPGGTSPGGIPSLIVNGGTLTATAYNVLGDVTLNGAKITGASVDPSTGYRGFELRGQITVGGTAPSLIETTTAHEDHLDAVTIFLVNDVTSSAATDLLVTAPLRDASPDNGSILGGLVKTGAGTMELTGVNTYLGATDIQAGTLTITGSLAATPLSVESGATLSGTGRVGGPVTVASGAFLAPGPGAGTLAAGSDVTLGGTLKVEIDGAASDRINVAGMLDISSATVDFSALAGGATQASYVIAQYGTLTGTAFASVQNLPAGYSLVYNYGSGSNQIALVTSGADPFSTWASGFHLSGANALSGADPDHDGVANAIEFVIGGDPAVGGDLSKLPTAAVVEGNLEFTYRRSDLSNSAAPLPFVEYGSTLTGWTTAHNSVNGVVITATNDFYGTGIDRVVVKIPQALASGQKLFVRLNANR